MKTRNMQFLYVTGQFCNPFMEGAAAKTRRQIHYFWCNELASRRFRVWTLSGFTAREQRRPIIYDHTVLWFIDFRKNAQE